MSTRTGPQIAFLIGSANIGGTETQMVRLCTTLAAKGWRPKVVFFQAVGPLLYDLTDAGVPWHGIGFSGVSMSRIPGVPTKQSISSLARLLRARERGYLEADVVHALLDWSVAFGRVLQPRGSRATKFVAGIRGQRTLTDSLTKRLFSRNVRRSDAVICNAPHLADEMVSDFSADRSRIVVVPNGVNLPDKEASVEVAPARGVTVANFHSYKGHAVLLDALAQVDVSVAVRFCGIGDLRAEMSDRAGRLGISERVIFVDPPADVPRELAAAQFGVHPSLTEGMSNAILEQLAAGLPVIAANVGANSLLVEDGKNGFLVPPGDAPALARAITAVTSDPQLRIRMGAASRLKAEQFSWSACTQAHVDVYTRLIETGWP